MQNKKKGTERNYKTARKKHLNGNKYIHIDNHFKYKWTKSSNQMTYSG